MSVVWFPGIGFRPAIWASHRADEVDPQRPQIAPDADLAYLAKFDWTAPPLMHPLTADGWLVDPLPITQPALATPGGTGPSHSGFPVSGGLIDCCTITWPGLLPRPEDGTPGEGTPDPDLPPIAAVPLSGSGLFLAIACAALPLVWLIRWIKP